MKSKLVALLGGVALSLGLASAASAADMAPRPYAKAPAPIAVAMYNWSGFYLGINGGGAWSRKCWDIAPFTVLGGLAAPVVITVPGGPEGCHNANGGTIGGQIGYRWQASAWVFGLEAQGNWADLTGSNTSTFGFFGGTVGNRTKIDALGLFTASVGYSWNNFLLYVKGGAAVTRDNYYGYTVPGSVVFDSARETRWGGTVGIGGEYSFTQNLSLALEYDHLFMGNRDITFTSVTAPFAFSRRDNIRQDVDLFTARLNYRFGGPIVAKY
jgi:outer membrane immunogenic protein